MDASEIVLENDLYPTLQFVCRPTKEAPTQTWISCSADPAYGWDYDYNLSGYAYNSQAPIGYFPYTNWSRMRLPLDHQFGTKTFMEDAARFQYNSSQRGWAAPVMGLTPSVEPLANMTPDVSVNSVTYPNVTIKVSPQSDGGNWTEEANLPQSPVFFSPEGGGNAMGAPDPVPTEAPSDEKEESEEKIGVNDTGKFIPISTAKLTPSPEESQGRMGLLLISLGALALAALATLLWLLRIRRVASDSPTRQGVLQDIETHPGAQISDIGSRMGISASTVTYHLQRLAKERKVVACRSGRSVRFFKAGQIGAKEKMVIAALSHPVRKRILQAILERQKLENASLVKTVGEDPHITHYHTRKLIDHGLVRADTSRHRVSLEINQECLKPIKDTLQSLGQGKPGDSAPPSPARMVVGEPAYNNA